MKRAEELGHTIYFTTEHGFGGDVLEALNLKDKYDIKVCFAMEGYIVPDPLEKDKSNHHIVLIARTDDARKKLNKINSRANKEGYYYKPRIFIDDLLKLDKDEIYITTACVNGIIANEEIYNKVFIPLVEHFGDSVFLEVQTHDEVIQKQLNQRARVIANKFNLKLIHGNDSHYIYEEQGSERLEYLKGKNMSYDDEDNFILDYPSYDVILNRYRKQGILSDDEAKEALENTLILDDCEEINIDKSIKMPTLYPDLTPNERYEKLRHLIYEKWLEEKERIPKEKHQEYIDAISFEMNIIKETNEEVHTADYFLLNYEIVKLAKEKYGGVLTKTGRGSGVSFYINRLLDLTGIDRLDLDVPIYPTRFISKSRLLETKSLPDYKYSRSI
jgi:DNA polymerase III alpha subunit